MLSKVWGANPWEGATSCLEGAGFSGKIISKTEFITILKIFETGCLIM
jgi:hypothetical protein